MWDFLLTAAGDVAIVVGGVLIYLTIGALFARYRAEHEWREAHSEMDNGYHINKQLSQDRKLNITLWLPLLIAMPFMLGWVAATGLISKIAEGKQPELDQRKLELEREIAKWKDLAREIEGKRDPVVRKLDILRLRTEGKDEYEEHRRLVKRYEEMGMRSFGRPYPEAPPKIEDGETIESLEALLADLTEKLEDARLVHKAKQGELDDLLRPKGTKAA